MGLAAYVAFCRDVEMKNIWRAAELVDAEELRLLTGRFYEDVERDVAAAAVALWRAEMEARADDLRLTPSVGAIPIGALDAHRMLDRLGVDGPTRSRAVFGYVPESAGARSQDFQTAGEISRRSRHRPWPRPPLSPTARALNYPTENTTPDAGTSRAEDASAMKR